MTQRQFTFGLVMSLMYVLCAITPLYGWQGRVIQVIDGDTMVVMKGEESVNVRLYGIDCPEGNQASGREAWIFASRLVNGNQVEVQPIDIDRYGRTVATVHLAQATPQSPKPKPPPASAAPYHGNVSSLIFHDSSCQHYDCKACTAAFTTRQQALDAGYRSCRKCGAK